MPRLGVEHIALEKREKGFSSSVIATRSNSSHRSNQVVILQGLSVSIRTELATPVGMDNTSVRVHSFSLAVHDCYSESIDG